MQSSYNNYSQEMPHTHNMWPYLEAKSYSDWKSILQYFPHLKLVNTPLDLSTQINANGIIIRSANDDNVHKAIKYNIWTTTPKNKNKIQQLWHRKINNNINTYLFFSAVKSGMFEGVARLKSGYHQETFPFWWENHTLKFKGYFELQWVYIKDVNNKHFEGLNNQQGEEASKSKDCDTLDSETTVKMLTVFDNKATKRTIFNDFAYMDQRESQYIRKMYEVSSYYSQLQGYNSNMDLNQYNLIGHQFNLMTNVNPVNVMNPMIIPPTLLRPTGSEGQQRNSLGFQMNPISKNKKK